MTTLTTPRRRTSVSLLVACTFAMGMLLASCGKSNDQAATGGSPSVATSVALTGSPTFDKMSGRGKVIIGVKEDQPNLGYKDPVTGTYSGFDISMANLIAAQLGFGADKIEYKAIPSANREQAIVNGDVDYYVGTYSITDKRKEQIGFAGPYYVAGQDLLVRKDDNSITGPDSLAGKKVCSVTGSTPIQKIKTEHPEAQVVEFEKYSQCVDALINNQVDTLTTDDAILKGYAAQQPDKLKVVGKTFSTEKYGVGVPKDDTALRNKISDILETAAKDGEWMKIYNDTLGKSGSPGTAPPLTRY
jgi:glutamate transport system substrate-binding protein